MNNQSSSEINIIGDSLEQLKSFIEVLAASNESTLFVGDRGTGKELFVKLYSAKSKKKNIVPLNCAASNDQLLYSDLFGHKKGAYTDAKKDRDGLLKKHFNDSILFFDEIGDSSAFFQASLLRVIEYGDYKPLGSDQVEKIPPDSLVIVAATSKFTNIRPDLQDRFQRIIIPKLLNRGNDIIALLKHFCGPMLTEITENALSKIKKMGWEGNVREFENTIKLSKQLCRFNNDKVIRENYIIPSQFSTFYQSGETDSSKKKKISKLNSKSKPMSINKFLEETVEMRLKLSNQPKRINTEIYNISGGLDNVAKAIKEIRFNPEKIGNKIDFKTTSPKEYDKLFWQHHKDEGHSPRYMKENFKYPISTASSKLRKFREK